MFKPEIKIEKFEVMDVITTSETTGGGGEPGDLPEAQCW